MLELPSAERTPNATRPFSAPGYVARTGARLVAASITARPADRTNKRLRDMLLPSLRSAKAPGGSGRRGSQRGSRRLVGCPASEPGLAAVNPHLVEVDGDRAVRVDAEVGG